MSAEPVRGGGGGEPEPGLGLGDEPELGRSFWVGLALGLPILLFGAYGLLNDVRSTHVDSWARFFVGFLIAHDAALVPIVVLTGALVARVVPARVRAPVQAMLIVGGSLFVIAFPSLDSPARASTNPTILPLPYEHNLEWIELLVFAIGVVLAVVAWRRTRAGAS